jgi:lipoprotein-anchoring transpeptidase ErfK/SrfK
MIHPGQDVHGRGRGSNSASVREVAFRGGLLVVLSLLLGACATLPPGSSGVSRATRAMYAAVDDGDFVVPAIPDRYLTPESVRQEVDFWTDEPPGSIVVDPYSYFLYYVLGDDRAIRYRVGVGAAGRTFAGRASVGYKRRWPSWTPTANMIRIEPTLYGPWAGGMAPGLENPLGSRAMYLYRGGRDSMYRIHGTYEPGSIGNSQSAGCIRMFQQDAMDLYERVDVGARVRVLGPSQMGMGTSPGRPA